MNKIPRISDAEWEVMWLVWNEGPLTANEIVKRLEPKTKWKRRTIRTLIHRLLEKDALTAEKEQRAYVYHARVKESECVREENRSFLQRVHRDRPKLLLSSFIEEAELDDSDIDELQEMLSKARGK